MGVRCYMGWLGCADRAMHSRCESNFQSVEKMWAGPTTSPPDLKVLVLSSSCGSLSDIFIVLMKTKGRLIFESRTLGQKLLLNFSE